MPGRGQLSGALVVPWEGAAAAGVHCAVGQAPAAGCPVTQQPAGPPQRDKGRLQLASKDSPD